MKNVDTQTAEHFGQEWNRFDNSDVDPEIQRRNFENYFFIFPWRELPKQAVGIDVGCGSGRWAAFVSERVSELFCVDASGEALSVARRNLGLLANIKLEQMSAGDLRFPDGKFDFGYSLGVLHHVPDTEGALRDCARKLKPGAPFLLYLYYSLDNRPIWYRWIWQVSDVLRFAISHLPSSIKHRVCDLIAVFVYWPLARFSNLLERFGLNPGLIPLSAYRNQPWPILRNDALDRFGTPLEKRYSRKEIEALMQHCGFRNIIFHEREPYWIACGRRI